LYLQPAPDRRQMKALRPSALTIWPAALDLRVIAPATAPSGPLPPSRSLNMGAC